MANRGTGAAAAGLLYVTMAAAESVDFFGAPDRSSPVGAVTRYYAENHSLAVFTGVAGVVGLVAYVVFAVLLWRWLVADGDGAVRRWAALGLLGGISGPLLAGVGQAGNWTLISRGSELTSADAAGPFDLYLSTRIVALVAMAATVVGMTTAGVRARRFPSWAAVAASVLGAYLLLASGSVFTDSAPFQTIVLGAFFAHAVWVVVVAGRVLLPRWAVPGEDPLAVVVVRVMFGAVVLAAGVAGLALLVFPASTDRFFSWDLTPAPLAALIGGFYLGSSVSFALALSASWRAARGMVAGIVVLATPIFAVSVAHRDVFDFGKVQAWLWMVFFALFPLASAAVLVVQGSQDTLRDGPQLTRWTRTAVGAIGSALFVLAFALLVDPVGASSWWPFDLPRLGGRVLACWLLFLAFLGGWAAVRGRTEDARLPITTIAALSMGACAAVLRTWSVYAPN